eukprot:9492414-Pyramimonas_sp.AAC.2
MALNSHGNIKSTRFVKCPHALLAPAIREMRSLCDGGKSGSLLRAPSESGLASPWLTAAARPWPFNPRGRNKARSRRRDGHGRGLESFEGRPNQLGVGPPRAFAGRSSGSTRPQTPGESAWGPDSEALRS